MVSRELEFRGIHSEIIEEYIEELGGVKEPISSPITYIGDRWTVEILSEGEIAFTSSFTVNTIHIRFTADHENGLEDLLKRFRHKTMRAGG